MSEEYSNRVVYELGAVSIAAGIVLVRLTIQRTWGKYDETRTDLRGLTVVITGASGGLGKQTALELLKKGARVIIGCRNEQKALQAITDIQSKATVSKSEGNIVYRHLDLCSFDSVVDFAREIEREDRVHVLINNAGVYCPPFELTEDGYETTMQANYLGHSLLTALLLPKLAESGTEKEPSRIVSVSSTHYIKGDIRAIDFEQNKLTERNYEPRGEYNNSKLAMAAYSRYVARKVQAQGLHVNMYTVSPGLVFTGLGRHMKQTAWKSLLFLPFALIFLRTPHQGVQSILQCALSTRLTKSTGEVYRNCRKTEGRGPLSSHNERETLTKCERLTNKVISDRLTPRAKEIINA